MTGDKDIKSVADLRGKRIAMGRIPQVIWGYEPDALLRNGYDDDFYKSLKIQFVGTSEAATALVNGQVDAATIGGYMDPVSGKFSPAPQTVEVLASGRELTHLDWTKDAVEKTAAKDIRLFPHPGSGQGRGRPGSSPSGSARICTAFSPIPIFLRNTPTSWRKLHDRKY